jgi:ABC-type microcin C transport system permease subunit YejE
MLFGGSINYGVYTLIVLTNDFALENPVIGVAAGSICGMFANLLSSRLILFRHATR